MDLGKHCMGFGFLDLKLGIIFVHLSSSLMVHIYLFHIIRLLMSIEINGTSSHNCEILLVLPYLT